MVIQLVREWTRQRNLCYAWICSESDSKHITELWGRNAHNFVWTKEPNKTKITNYFDTKELDIIYAWVREQIKTNPSFIPLVKKRFLEPLEKADPYVKGKKITSFDELHGYYALLLAWRSPEDSIFIIPDLDGVPESVKSELLALRKQTQHIFDIIYEPITNFLEKQFPQYKNVLDVMLPEEMFSLEKGPLSKEKLSELEKRNGGCAIFNGKVYSLEELPQELKKHGFELAKEVHENQTQLSGMCAYPGKVQGKVAAITSKEDIKKITKGSIVVAEMTSPSIVTLLSQAAGIITDEGGVTCHAAIVAREFKIPCLVGTKSATKLLKDGDLVELDAAKGTAKKLT